MEREINYDPTESFEAWEEMQADLQLEEMKLKKEFKKEVFEYVDSIYLVNRSEIEMAIGDAYIKANGEKEGHQLSYWELSEVVEMVDEYIEKKWITFDEDGDIIEINEKTCKEIDEEEEKNILPF